MRQISFEDSWHLLFGARAQVSTLRCVRPLELDVLFTFLLWFACIPLDAEKNIPHSLIHWTVARDVGIPNGARYDEGRGLICKLKPLGCRLRGDESWPRHHLTEPS